MSRRKIILALVVLFSTGAFLGQSLSQTSETQPEYKNDFEQDQQITSEENKKQMWDWSTGQMAEFEIDRRRFERLRGETKVDQKTVVRIT